MSPPALWVSWSASASPVIEITDAVLVMDGSRLSKVRSGLGLAQLLVPAVAAGVVAGQRPDPRGRRVVRVLGARQLAQALTTGFQPTTAVLALGAEVDAAHGLSMAALGLFDRRLRRLAWADGLLAAGFMTAGVVAARAAQGRVAPGGLAGWRDRCARRVAHWLVPAHLREGW